MKLRELTRDDVIAYAQHLKTKYNFSIFFKGNSLMMEIAGEILGIAGITDKASFMNDYCTTVADRVYLTFVPGEDLEFSFFDQVRILAHEATHVVQYRRDGVKFAWMYANSPEERASFEAEAAKTEIPLVWRYYGEKYDTAAKAERLAGYGCTREQMQMVKDLLDRTAEIVYQGGVTTDVARESVAWLKLRGVLP